MTKKEFRRRLGKEIKLRIREMRDGCLKCRDCGGGLCIEHMKEAFKLQLTPTSEIELTAEGIVIKE